MSKYDVTELVAAAKLLLTAAVDFAYARVRELQALETQPKMYTYWFGLKPSDPEGYLSGTRGTATFTAPVAGEVIDVVICASPALFVLDSVMCGAHEQLNGYAVPADVFYPTVQNRFVRFTELAADETVTVAFRRVVSDQGFTRERVMIAIKVRSTAYLPPADDQNQTGGLS